MTDLQVKYQTMKASVENQLAQAEKTRAEAKTEFYNRFKVQQQIDNLIAEEALTKYNLGAAPTRDTFSALGSLGSALGGTGKFISAFKK